MFHIKLPDIHIKKSSFPKKTLCFTLPILLALAVLMAFLPARDARTFKALSDDLFYSELSGNTLNLHYTLAHPERYGFDGEAVLSSYEPGADDGADHIRSALNRLAKISPEKLNESDAYTYGLLTRYLTLRLMGTPYTYYSEPLSPSSGMQSGLPILLADYTFRSEKDVEDYLHILDQTDTYFEGLIQYEKEKAQKGLFMSDSAAQAIIEQCCAIMDKDTLSSGSHFLHTTFKERLKALEDKCTISEEQKSLWISENDRLLTTVMAPAYEDVADAFTILSGSGLNDMGLYYFPDGRAYYEYLLAMTTGSYRSIPEIKALLFSDFRQNLTSLSLLLKKYPELSSFAATYESFSFPYSDPEEMLNDLKSRMSADFPAFPETSKGFQTGHTIKQVSPSMEDYCSPAYYLTPPIDDMENNIIYINHKNPPDPLTLYTTLAHEGYPGHLYQTVYSHLYMNQGQTPRIRYLLHYGGYVEGWAYYVENLSYYYAQSLTADSNPLATAWIEACRLNRNLQLCMYSLLDIAIHYEGATPAKVQTILHKIGITDPETVALIYEYIVNEPATYLKYYLGFLEFLSLKDKARDAWGDEFSLMRFHRFILESGPSDFQGLNERLH